MKELTLELQRPQQSVRIRAEERGLLADAVVLRLEERERAAKKLAAAEAKREASEAARAEQQSQLDRQLANCKLGQDF
eukprot:3203911-Prymnesium_polylepis.1